jgi:hypothetical protein
MKRSILLSLLIIGAAATLLGSGTFAVFTTFSSDSGVLSSGSISMSVLGSGPNTLLFTTGSATCPSGLFPGDFCTDLVTVKNTSTVPIKITSVGVSELGGLETCGGFPGNSLSSTLTPSIIGNTLAPNGTTTTTVKTTLDSAADSSCEGQTATVGVSVGASTP